MGHLAEYSAPLSSIPGRAFGGWMGREGTGGAAVRGGQRNASTAPSDGSESIMVGWRPSTISLRVWMQ